MIYFVTNRPIKIYIQCVHVLSVIGFCHTVSNSIQLFRGAAGLLGGVQVHPLHPPPGYAYDQDTVFYLFISMVYCGTILHW